MKVKYFVLPCIIFLLSCSIETCTEPQIQILQNDETFDKLLFFDFDTEPKRQVAGIDPETFEIKVRIASITHRLCDPFAAPDGRLFIVPIVPKLGIHDDEIIVLNKYGKPIKKLKGFYSTAILFVVDKYLVIGGSWTTDNGKYPVGFINLDNYNVEFYEGMLNDMLWDESFFLRWKNYIFLKSSSPFGVSVIRVNINNLNERIVTTNYVNNNTSSLFWGSWLIDVDNDRLLTFDWSISERGGKVMVYDLNTEKLLTNWYIVSNIDLSDKEEVACRSVIISNEILVYVSDMKETFARMLVYDKNNYNFLYEIDLSNMILPQVLIKHIRGTKIYFDTSEGIFIYDHSKKKCVRHITPEEVMGR